MPYQDPTLRTGLHSGADSGVVNMTGVIMPAQALYFSRGASGTGHVALGAVLLGGYSEAMACHEANAPDGRARALLTW